MSGIVARAELGSPAVVSASRHQLAPGEVVGPFEFTSRCVVWAYGGGELRCAGQRVTLDPGVVVVIPWRRRVEMRAAPAGPVWMHTVHIAPWHDPEVPIESDRVDPHSYPLSDDPARQDREWPGFDGLTILRGTVAARIKALTDAVVDAFWERSPVAPPVLRAYGIVLVDALLGMAADPPESEQPPLVRIMTSYVRLREIGPVPVEKLARVAQCSVSTVERLFRRHLGVTPNVWIRGHRLEYAANLLISGATVSEAARASGYDPDYFRRLFTRHFGIAPSRYRPFT